MYICVGQKVHNIIFIFYFYIGKTKLEKKKGEHGREARTQVTWGKTRRKPKPTWKRRKQTNLITNPNMTHERKQKPQNRNLINAISEGKRGTYIYRLDSTSSVWVVRYSVVKRGEQKKNRYRLKIVEDMDTTDSGVQDGHRMGSEKSRRNRKTNSSTNTFLESDFVSR